jgi:hypothetical protein
LRVLFSQKLIVISKPRCGSTSLRRMLDGMMDKSRGDMAVDVAGQRPPYHPHLSAPYLKQLLQADGHDLSGMTTIMVTRHPVQMLWSYFKFFQPDARSQYNFSPKYDVVTRMGFQDWVKTGRVGINAGVKALVPPWVSERDLSPLSLEAHADRSDGTREVDVVFQIEKPDALVDWLRQRTARPVQMMRLNTSPGDLDVPELDAEALHKIRAMFPEESRIYRK